MMPDQPADARVGTVIAGYRIDGLLGRGGMGVVFEAEHLTLRRRAALKIIVPELAVDADFRERFIREARIAATLVHPNVVTVYDAGEVEGELYIAMQLVPGHDLAALLREEGRLGPYRALDVCRQVAAALDTAHARGLIHRDVKPANVLLDGRQAYLTDFGLTKDRAGGTRAQLTRSGEVVGTTHYVAPEQVEGQDVDARADVYALGCLLFHCLTGEVPFSKESDMAVMYAHVHEEPPRLTEKRPGLPVGLDAVMAKALDKVPDRRFRTCEDLIQAARAVVDAHGPLSESSATRRKVPAGGDDPNVPTAVGRGVPAGGDTSSIHTLTGVRGPGGRRAVVLLAGVEPSAAAIARVALTNRCDIHEAPDLDAALPLAREARPDIVLVGFAAAGAPAAGLIAALRADAVTADAKIVLLTGFRATRRDLAAVGADESLPAPFSPLQLQVKLRKLLAAPTVGS